MSKLDVELKRRTTEILANKHLQGTHVMSRMLERNPPVRGIVAAGVYKTEKYSFLDDSITVPRGYVLIVDEAGSKPLDPQYRSLQEGLHLSTGRDKLGHPITVDHSKHCFFVAEDCYKAQVGKYRLNTAGGERPRYLDVKFEDEPGKWKANPTP